MPSVRGARPTATSTFSASSACCFPSLVVKVTFTPWPACSTLSTLVPTCEPMPRLRKTRASSLLTSSSSFGTSRGRYSRMVTSEPKLRKMEPNSTPTAPAPITISDFGMRSMLRISTLVSTRSSAFRPGSMRASEPVESSTFFACTCAVLPSAPFTFTVCTPPLAPPVSVPQPGTTVTLFLRIRNSRPFTCFAMIWFLRSRIAAQFSVTSPTPSMPNSLACFRWS